MIGPQMWITGLFFAACAGSVAGTKGGFIDGLYRFAIAALLFHIALQVTK